MSPLDWSQGALRDVIMLPREVGEIGMWVVGSPLFCTFDEELSVVG